jgi:adenylate kinase family enzyme
MPTQNIIAVSGRPGSGKTTFAASLASALGAQHISFGNVVRAEAQSLGLRQSRSSLQVLGQLLVAEALPRFCRMTLTRAGWPTTRVIVLDGLRHCEVADEIESLARPASFLLVHIDVSAEIAVARLAARGDEAESRIDGTDPTEQQVTGRLRRRASIVIDGTRPTASLVQSVVALIR